MSPLPPLEPEAPQRRAVGSAQVSAGLPADSGPHHHEDDSGLALLEFVRHGLPTGADAVGVIVVPAAELSALVLLISGTHAQMRENFSRLAS